MKNLLKYILVFGTGVTLFSCEKDNYAEPNAMLSGNLLYQGDTIYVEKNSVHFQIYQYGFGKVGPISTDETFAENGSYSAALFDGSYKLIIPNGDGPFMWPKTAGGAPDSIAIDMKGSQTVDLQVTPYWMIQNASLTGSASSVNATFKLAQIVTDADAKTIERVSLYINKTQFVSGGNNIAHTDVDGASIADPNNVTLSVAVPSMTPTQNYVYARVGVKLAGVEDMIFSPLVQVSF